MANEPAKALYNQFLDKLRAEFIQARSKAKIESTKEPVLPGAFGQYMNIDMTNDGPVTLIWESFKDPKALAKQAKLKARQDKIDAQRQEKEAKKKQLAAQTAASVNDDSSMVSASAGESQLETTNGTGNDTA